MLSPLLSFLTLSPLQGFSSRETDFHFCQFLSNFLKYSFSNFPLSYLYNIFAINFPGNFPLLKSFSSAISNFFCLLTSVFILPSNSSNVKIVDSGLYFIFHFYFTLLFFSFNFLFLEQLRLGVISHAVTSVTT